VNDAEEWAQWKAQCAWFDEHAAELATLADIERAQVIARRMHPQQPLWCESCGVRTPRHRHHSDYQRPGDIVWLCVFCHRRIHPRGKSAAIRDLLVPQAV
jgi:hypothetical protein